MVGISSYFGLSRRGGEMGAPPLPPGPMVAAGLDPSTPAEFPPEGGPAPLGGGADPNHPHPPPPPPTHEEEPPTPPAPGPPVPMPPMPPPMPPPPGPPGFEMPPTPMPQTFAPASAQAGTGGQVPFGSPDIEDLIRKLRGGGGATGGGL